MSERLLDGAQAIREAIDGEMARDPSVFVMGLGVDDFRGTFGTTLGLKEKHGAARVFDTPLSEDTMTGVAVGAALAGLRPIHIHIRMDFVLLAMNQLANMAAKARYMWGGSVHVPMVVRCIIGRSWGQGAQHSQALHALLMHIPGLKVAAPSTPYDAKGLLTESIRDDNPVVFVEHRMVHRLKGHVPEGSYTVPFGKARVLAEGSDVTIVGVLHAAAECMRARALLESKGLKAEVIDPVSLSPLDIAAIAGSAQRTGRLLVVDNAWTACGASAEILAQVAELSGPAVKMRRMGFAPVPCPTTRNLETLFYPSAGSIASAAWGLCTGDETWRPASAEAPEIKQFKGPF